jgi:HAMP domain-containing protein
MTPAESASEWIAGLRSLGRGGGLLVLVFVVLGGWCALALRRWLERRSRRRRSARAQRAERDAAALLEASGFLVLGRQRRQRWALDVDGRALEFTLVADYLVERGGRRWVAEVKTGERALDLRHGPTRRQLLEYQQAFGVDGVLLVDAEGQRLQRVSFLERRLVAGQAPRASRLWLFAAGLLSGLALGLWLGAHGAG